MTRLLRSVTLAVLLVVGLWAGATAADLFDAPAAVTKPSAAPTTHRGPPHSSPVLVRSP